MPTEASTGDLLLGSISYGQSKSNLIGSGKKPDGFPISMRVPPINKVKTKSSGSKNNKKDKKPETEKLAEAIRDLKVARLTKLHGEKNSENFDLIAKEILTVDPDYLPVLVEQLRRLDGETNRKKHLEEIITAADVVINKIDTETLAKHYGIKLNQDDDIAQAERKKIDKKLNTLTDALYRKGRALGYLETQLRENKDINADIKKTRVLEVKDKFEANFSELQK